MTPNPILKVLLVMRGCRVRFLLMGGQACVLYGGSEFSRDTDLAIMPDMENMDRLRKALTELKAEPIAVPELSIENLKRGHAIHFRCKHPDALEMRIDLMSTLRNAPPFEVLWDRRSTLELSDGVIVDIVSLPDLISIKKTQRDKDWSHIRRLIEANFLEHREGIVPEHARFWLMEARTIQILRSIAAEFPNLTNELKVRRPLLRLLPGGSDEELSQALADEEKQERTADRAYWDPLVKELEQFRHDRNNDR